MNATTADAGSAAVTGQSGDGEDQPIAATWIAATWIAGAWIAGAWIAGAWIAGCRDRVRYTPTRTTA